HRLESYEIHTGKGAEKTRVTLRSVFLRENPPVSKSGNFYGYAFVVQRAVNRHVTVEVRGRTGGVVLQPPPKIFDLGGLQAFPDYGRLTPNLQAFLRQLYEEAA